MGFTMVVKRRLSCPCPPDQAVLLRLAPLLVPQPRRGVLGNSRYARTLRDAVRHAAHDEQRRPVLISGEPWLEKDNLAALIHYGSPSRQQFMLRLDGALLKADGIDLFGSEAEPGLLELVGDGALPIHKFDQVCEPLQLRLQELARSEPDQLFQGRLFFTAESSVPALDRCCTLIRVPPLRVRRQDLGEWLRYGVGQRSRKLGWAKPPAVPDAVVKRL
ncbi:hypothetical protein [Synechococcus sp. CBW1107]|uniref:hypothetical protein n=1 Tax=Synechococcus sp. CBW1107 TaxID=2789857 RepID=UPI003A0FBC27